MTEILTTVGGKEYPMPAEYRVPAHIKIAALLLGGTVKNTLVFPGMNPPPYEQVDKAPFAKDVIMVGDAALQRSTMVEPGGRPWLVTGLHWTDETTFHTVEEAFDYLLSLTEEHGHD